LTVLGGGLYSRGAMSMFFAVVVLVALAAAAFWALRRRSLGVGDERPDEPTDAVPPRETPRAIEAHRPSPPSPAVAEAPAPPAARAAQDRVAPPKPAPREDGPPPVIPVVAAPTSPAPATPEPELLAPAPTSEPAPRPKPVEAVVDRPQPAVSSSDSGAPSKEQISALKRGLASTRGGFVARLARLFGGRKDIDPALLDQIEEVLITADIGVGTTEKLLAKLRERHARRELDGEDAVWRSLRTDAAALLGKSLGPLRVSQSPTTILVVGVNGVGKTTTIGKLASRFKAEGKSVVLAAGDTFRAAAVLQLEVWAKRVGCEIVKGKDRADSASVLFEAIKKAQAERADVVIADTAGRLHTKQNLMEELKKVVRSAEKALERPVDEVLLVLDSTTGQNAIQQTQIFKEAIAVSGIVLTKLDGTAKGGVVLGIVDEHQVPVRYIGIGERLEDLRVFEPGAFVEALFTKPDVEGEAS